MDCSLSGSSIHGILQVLQERMLEKVAISFSRGSSQPRNRTQAGRFFTDWAMRVAIITPGHYAVLLSVSLLMCVIHPRGVPGCTSGKEPACQCRRHRDPGLISGWRRSPGGGHGKPLQYSCLRNPWTKEIWTVTVLRVAQSPVDKKWLSTHSCDHPLECKHYEAEHFPLYLLVTYPLLGNA